MNTKNIKVILNVRQINKIHRHKVRRNILINTKRTDNYNTQKGIECLSSCIYNKLYNDGINIRKSDIFFAGNGFELHYTGKFESRMIYSKQYESNYKFIKLFMGKSRADNYHSNAFENMRDFLIKQTEENGEVIIRVSSSWLPYNKVFHDDKAISHYINVLDYETGRFVISDGCPPVTGNEIYFGTIEENVLIDNWKNMNGEYFIIKYDRQSLSDVSEYAGSVLKKQLLRYLKCDYNPIRKKYNGYKCFLTMLEDMQPLFDNEVAELGKIVLECNQQFRINGFLQSKEFLLEKLREISIDENMVNNYEDIYKQWNRLLLMLTKAGIKQDKKLFLEILKEADRLTCEENILIQKVYNIL